MKISRRSFCLLMAGACCTGVLAACGSSSSPTASSSAASASAAASGEVRDELIFVNYRDIRDLNPHLYAGEMYAQSILYDTLVSITADGYEGCLAESWDISEDGRVHGAPPTIVIKEARSPVSIKSFSSFFCSDIVDVSRALVPIISA